jgi:alginate O-acetyltransferase complex protein AlgI
VLLWQHWHMTLTHWLRVYVFVPVSRALMRRDVGGREGPVVVAQVATMVLCGLWHGLAWHFALWGFLHAVGLIWVGVIARRVGAHLPGGVVTWWRRNPVAAAVATAVTFTYFAVTLVFVVADMDLGWHILRRLVAA